MSKIIKRIEIVLTVDTDDHTQSTIRKYENLSHCEAIGLLHYERERLTQDLWQIDHPEPESEVKPDAAE